MSVRSIIAERFAEPSKCHGHCDQPAGLRFLSDGAETVTVTACSKGYVSRVAVYGLGDNAGTLKSLVRSALGPSGDLRDEDVRTATRYAWDLGFQGRTEPVVFRVAYWTQNYRRTKSDDPNRKAVFSCGNCSSLFLQPISSTGVLCPACSKQG